MAGSSDEASSRLDDSPLLPYEPTLGPAAVPMEPAPFPEGEAEAPLNLYREVVSRGSADGAAAAAAAADEAVAMPGEGRGGCRDEMVGPWIPSPSTSSNRPAVSSSPGS